MGAPGFKPAQTPFIMSASSTARNSVKRRRAMGATNDAGSNLERIEMTTHVGTHMDALGHFSKGDLLYGGHPVDDTVDDWGLLNLGIEHCPPIITRGVMLDVAGADGGHYPGERPRRRPRRPEARARQGQDWRCGPATWCSCAPAGAGSS